MLIKSGRVQVNFKPEIKTSIQLKEGIFYRFVDVEE